MTREVMFLLGCMIAGYIVLFSFLWSMIHREEEEAEEWQEEMGQITGSIPQNS